MAKTTPAQQHHQDLHQQIADLNQEVADLKAEAILLKQERSDLQALKLKLEEKIKELEEGGAGDKLKKFLEGAQAFISISQGNTGQLPLSNIEIISQLKQQFAAALEDLKKTV